MLRNSYGYFIINYFTFNATAAVFNVCNNNYGIRILSFLATDKLNRIIYSMDFAVCYTRKLGCLDKKFYFDLGASDTRRKQT